MTAGIIASFVGAAVLQAVVALGLHLFARWVARRRKREWGRAVAWLPAAGLALSITAVFVSVACILNSPPSLDDVDPSQKAALLAAAISESMNCGALLALPAWLFFFSSLVISIVGSLSLLSARLKVAKRGARSRFDDRA